MIKNPGGADDGITVSQSAAGFTLENGVVLTGVDRFLLSRITAISNGEYGLFPVFSSHVVIERSTATGHTDAGIYVGQSSNIEVRHSTAYGNVLGIEIENSTRVSVLDNESHDNVVGVMVVLRPGLTVKTSDGVRVLRNRVGDPGGGRRPRRHRRQRGDRQSIRRRRTRELAHPGGARGASAGGLR